MKTQKRKFDEGPQIKGFADPSPTIRDGENLLTGDDEGLLFGGTILR